MGNLKKKKNPERRNASEVLTVFLGLLSQREKPLILSAKHDYAPVAEYAAKFMATNQLPRIRENYPKIKPPPGTNHLTNVPEEARNTCALPPLTGEEAIDQILAIIRRSTGDQETAIMAGVLKILKGQHKHRIAQHRMNRNSSHSLMVEAMSASDQLDAVISGNFALLEFKTH